MNKEELQKYFTSDKSDWYKTVEGRQEWDLSMTTQFWNLIRENRNNGYNDYSNYIFPEFEAVNEYKKINHILDENENFWRAGEKREFKDKVSFNGSTFQGEVNFSTVQFKKSADFSLSRFNQASLFQRTTFNVGVYFSNSHFLKEAYFQNTMFDGNTYFYKVTFDRLITFDSAKFIGKTRMFKLDIKKLGNFRNIEFQNTSHVLFEDFIDNPQLDFENVIFSKNVIFRRIGLKNTVFLKSDIIELNLKECYWNNSNRIILKNEINGDYESLEGIYRQLKKNYENAKDWELSGKAYRSEMLMRRFSLHSSFISNWYKGLIIFNNFLWEWLFYLLYGRLSGFTQSILTPFVLMLSTVLGFGTFYFYIRLKEYSTFWGCKIIDSIEHVSFSDTLQFSLSVASPLFKTDLQYSNWWVQSFEKLIATILLVFFILALRKRFKF